MGHSHRFVAVDIQILTPKGAWAACATIDAFFQESESGNGDEIAIEDTLTDR